MDRMINAQKSVVFPFFPFSTEIIPAHTRLMAKRSGLQIKFCKRWRNYIRNQPMHLQPKKDDIQSLLHAAFKLNQSVSSINT